MVGLSRLSDVEGRLYLEGEFIANPTLQSVVSAWLRLTDDLKSLLYVRFLFPLRYSLSTKIYSTNGNDEDLSFYYM